MSNKGNIRVISGLLCGAAWLILATSSSANGLPHFQSLSRQYVLEGQRLEVNVDCRDADGDQLTLQASNRPVGSQFTDNGDGTGVLVWTPDFSGPNSSENSPFEITIWASDGVGSSSMNVELDVLNNNRAPVITAPSRVDIQSGQDLAFSAQGSDPDGDQLSWNILDLPAGAGYSISDGLSVDWPTAYADSGMHNIVVELTDQFGASDTALIVAAVAQTTVFAMSVDTLSAYPGEMVNINVNLDNLEPVSGFNVVVNYDASSMALASVMNAGTRSANFEYFTFKMNYRSISGDVNIVGAADPEGNGPGVNLDPGHGSIARLRFLMPSGSEYSGFALPIEFVFRDIMDGKDNTVTAGDGTQITQSQVDYADGYALVLKSTEEGIGDINLNGIAFEISDAIYLTNFFINPATNPLNARQRLNSDVNHDGLTGTVADLVYLILKIVNPGSYPKPVAGNPEVAFELLGADFKINSPVELGGLIVTAELADDAEAGIVSDLSEMGMTVKSGREGRTLRILVYGGDGQVLPSGSNDLFRIENNEAIEIKDVQAASADGRVLAAVGSVGTASSVPTGFVLHQNYPNPFNPATEIRFDLPYTAKVELKVFNVLGQEIATLLSRELPSGSHSVTWNGRDDYDQPVSSGVYFYRLEAGGNSISKKMILIK